MSVELIKALQNPTLYKHPTEGFQVLETHISWVILTGSYAYKIKKPVNFGFLDFSSLDKRKFYCDEELRLNRRLAPDLYLDVIPIYGTVSQPCLSSGLNAQTTDSEQAQQNNAPIEYALRMTQFDQAGLLDQLEEAQKLTSKHIQTLAHTLASFHGRVNTRIPDSNFGTPQGVFAPVIENFEQIQAQLTQLELIEELHPLQQWANASFQALKPLLERRRDSGFIRECHGDLHLGNITLFNQQIVIFDCIEFNASLSWVDTINDLAFLVMDLEKRGQDAFANQLTNQYLELTGDYQGAGLLRFYKAYRAMVRAKVAVLSLQPNTDDASAKTNHGLMEQYRQYITQAKRYINAPQRYILLMHGFSGSGKSHISRELVEQLGAIRIRTDVERKRLFNYNPSDNTQSPIDGGIYTQAATQKTYSHVASLATELLAGGIPVIIDAANLKQWQRRLFADLADSQRVPILIIACNAHSDTLEERVVKRAEQPKLDQEKDASEAKVDTLKQQRLSAEALSAEELNHTVQIHTDQPDPLRLAIREIKSRLSIN